MKNNQLRTTKTSQKLISTNMSHFSNDIKKKIFHKRDRPPELLEGILYDMEYLHSLLGTSKTEPTIKPGYQNYAEV